MLPAVEVQVFRRVPAAKGLRFADNEGEQELLDTTSLSGYRCI
jgi:hypothetical protein